MVSAGHSTVRMHQCADVTFWRLRSQPLVPPLPSPPLATGADVAYPKQPIRLVVPRSAGGVVDILARLSVLIHRSIFDDPGRRPRCIAYAVLRRENGVAALASALVDGGSVHAGRAPPQP